ncbi:MAG: TonB-dependent receptor [Undibacterium sp.]|nr:TonB-dependent receptor [Opitutaceae bacterium]
MNHLTRSTLRLLRLSSLALLAAAGLSRLSAQTPTTAPAPSKDEPVVLLEAVSVTGSNIKRMDIEKVLPVTIISQDTMTARNALTPIDLISALPQLTSVPFNEATSGGAGARGDVSTVSLRGIGSGGTLLLLNGRRLAPHPITAGDSTSGQGFSPNANQLPTQGIDHIDVLRDGASSVYGSDAVAGVLNYIMKQDFRGTELRLRYGQPEYRGGASGAATISYGTDFAKGKGRLFTTIDYVYRQEIYLRDRSFSASANHTNVAPAPFNVLGSGFDARSAVLWPTYRLGANATAGTTRYFRPASGPGSTPADTTVAPTRAANPEYYNDINRYQQGSPRSVRFNTYSSFEYDLNPRLTVFGDLSYYHAKSDLIRQPIALNYPGADSLVIQNMSIDNPFNPFGNRFVSAAGTPNTDGSARVTGTPQGITLLTGNTKDIGDEHVQVNSNVFRTVGGLRGKFGSTWSWETGVLYTKGWTNDLSLNAVRESLLRDALGRTDATAYNPFGYTFKVVGAAVVPDKAYTNPVGVVDSFRTQFRHEGYSAIGSIDLRVGGEIVDIWGGAISLAGGGEFRKEQYKDYRPPFIGLNPASSGLNPNDNDLVTASAAPDSNGSRTVGSAYLETVIPLVAPKNGIPLVKSFEVTGSGRFERYSDFGSTTKPKVGVNWKPFDGVMLRGSYNQGFTAPNLATLYAPNRFTVDSLPGTIDPYRQPVTTEGAYVQRNYNRGNPNLKPSASVGRSAGIVLDVPRVKGLSVTADYWQISQSDNIGSLTSTQILNSDVVALNAYTQAQLASGVAVGSINAGSGTSSYKGSSAIERNPVGTADTTAFAAYNAGRPASQQVATVGQIVSRSVVFENLASGYVSGWDLGMNYVLPTFPIGKFNFNADWSYTARSYSVRKIPGSASVTNERLDVDGTTRWRGNFTVAWRKGAWNASFSGYYIGSYRDNSTGSTITAAQYTALGNPTYISKYLDGGAYAYRYIVRDSITYNSSVRYAFKKTAPKLLRETSIRLGVINLLDKEPPLTSGNFGYSASVYTGLLPGRTWTLDVTKRF